MNYLLAADLGTSSVKVALVDTQGNTIGCARREYPVYRPASDWVEQDARDYVAAAYACFAELMGRFPEARSGLLALAADGQTSTEIFLDRRGEVLAPAITWQDMRAREQARRLSAAFPSEKRRGMMGFSAPAGGNFTAPRLLWLKENRPDVFSRLYCVLQPKDYLNYCLTGIMRSDFWCNKSLCSLSTRRPADELMAFMGVPASVIPPIGDPWDVVGRVTSAAAAETGLPEGLPVICGFSDSIGTMMGSGAFARPGLGFNATGTSEIVGLTTEKDCPSDTLLTMPGAVMKAGSVLYGTTQCGGSALLWLNENVTHAPDYDTAVHGAEEVQPGSGGVVFLPYLRGERSPIWDEKARGAFLGLSTDHDSRHLTRAVMEGVAMSVRHCLEEAQAACGRLPEEVRILGGAGRADVWNQIRADITGIPYVTLACPESGALGVAMLAGYAVGVWDTIPAACEALIRPAKRYVPRPAYREMYDALYRQYRFGYEAQRMFRQAEQERTGDVG